VDGISKAGKPMVALILAGRLLTLHAVAEKCAAVLSTGAVARFLTESDRGEAGSRRIPVGFRLEVRYALAAIGDQAYLPPQTAVETALYNYRKYEAGSTIRFDP